MEANQIRKANDATRAEASMLIEAGCTPNEIRAYITWRTIKISCPECGSTATEAIAPTPRSSGIRLRSCQGCGANFEGGCEA
jgi:transposase-like protein